MNIPQSKKGNLWIGALLYYYGRAMFYLSIANFMMNAGTFWHTTLSQSVNVSLPIFIIGMLLLGLTAISLDYFWITPSLMAYSNKIGMEQNPIYLEICNIRDDLKNKYK